MLFGEQQYDLLPDELIDIIIDSGAARSDWAKIGEQLLLAEKYRNQQGVRGRLASALWAAGVPIAAVGTIYNAWKMKGWGHTTEKERKRLRQEQLAKEAEELKKSGEVELNAEGLIVGNKRDVEGKPKEASLPKEPATTQPVPEPEQPLPPPDDDEEDWFEEIFPPGASGSDPFNMDVDSGPGGTPEPTAARAGVAPGGGNQVSKETPISQYPSLSYGLQETHTTILPWVGWCSVAMGVGATPIRMSLRMNSIWDMFKNAIGTSPADGASFATPGIFGKPSRENGNASAMRFPKTMADGTSAAERPQWRDYWVQLYEYYTVLGCEYEIVVENPSANLGANVLVAHEFDSYSNAEGASGNEMPVAPIDEIMNFKNIRYDNVGSSSAGQNTAANIAIIKGTYKPGMIKRNIVNDGDVKTWTKADGSLPNLNEFLQIFFVKHPMAHASQIYTVNVQVKLKYIVQFKDLRKQARYPNSTVAGTITQVITNGVGDQVRQLIP